MPTPSNRFSVKKRARSFRYAFKGLADLFVQQHNARIHAVAAVGVVTAGLYLGLQAWEWCLLALTIGGVLAAELLNTAIEYTIDLVSPEQHPLAGKAKDAAAAAVLVLAIAAVVVGVVIFGPRLWALVQP